MIPTPVPPNGGGQGDTALSGLTSLFVGNLFNRAMGLFRVVLFAALLHPEGFGAYRLATTVLLVMSGLCGLGLQTSFLRFLPEIKQLTQQRRFIDLLQGRALFVALLAALVLVIFNGPTSTAIFSTSSHFILVLLIAACLPLMVLFKGQLGAARGLAFYRRSALAEAAQNLLSLVVAIPLLVYIGFEPELAFAAYLIATIVGALLLQRVVPLWGGTSQLGDAEQIDAELLRRAMRYSLWSVLIPLLHYLFDFIDRWSLAYFYDLEVSGVYSLVPVITGGMTLMALSLAPVITRSGAAFFAQGQKEKGYELVWVGWTVCILGSLIFSAAVMLLEPLIWLVFAANWEAASPIIPVFLIYFLLYSSFFILSIINSLREATWIHVLSLAIGLCSNLLLNLAWIPEHGMSGAAWASVVSMIVTLAVQLGAMVHGGVRIPLRVLLVFALCALPLASAWTLGVVVLVVLLLAATTPLFFSTEDRTMVAERFLAQLPFGRTK